VVDRETRKDFFENINSRGGKWWSIRFDYRTAILEAYVAESTALSS